MICGPYDSAQGPPGANDNASRVAARIEIAPVLAGQQAARTVRLVALVNEEPPFNGTSNMGGWCYANRVNKAKRRHRGHVRV